MVTAYFGAPGHPPPHLPASLLFDARLSAASRMQQGFGLAAHNVALYGGFNSYRAYGVFSGSGWGWGGAF